MMLNWKDKIDEIDADQISLVLGNFGDLPAFKAGDKSYQFRWPDQRVKAALTKDYLSEWSKTIEEMPDGKVKRELIRQMSKEVRSIGITQLVEYLGSGEKPIVNYMYHCSHEPKMTREDIQGHLFADTKDQETGQGFMEFCSLHIARALVVYVQGKGREAALEFLKNFKRTSVAAYSQAEEQDIS